MFVQNRVVGGRFRGPCLRVLLEGCHRGRPLRHSKRLVRQRPMRSTAHLTSVNGGVASRTALLTAPPARRHPHARRRLAELGAVVAERRWGLPPRQLPRQRPRQRPHQRPRQRSGLRARLGPRGLGHQRVRRGGSGRWGAPAVGGSTHGSSPSPLGLKPGAWTVACPAPGQHGRQPRRWPIKPLRLSVHHAGGEEQVLPPNFRPCRAL